VKKAASTSREEWQKRLERWKDSGLSAEQFSAELGINPGTLKYWKYLLGKEARRSSERTPSTISSTVPQLIELRSTPSDSAYFEVLLRNERRLRIPTKFDSDSLTRLLEILDPR
jgi:hypothetical protein